MLKAVLRHLLPVLIAWQFAFALSAQPPAGSGAPQTGSAKTTHAALPANDIFSGNVTAAGNGALTVLRKVPARADETRTFVLDAQTRVEGRLRVNARVSVRFRADSGGALHALRVVVRPDAGAGAGASGPVTAGIRR